MRGLELSECFYWEVVSPIIEKRLPWLKDRYAAGLIGYGSDVLGYDDEISRDHEWGPRGHIWLNEADYLKDAKRLDLILNEELPRKYLGFKTRFTVSHSIPALVPASDDQPGMHHIAITTVPRYLKIQLGIRRLPLDVLDWLCLPEQKLLELTRGRIFHDPVGEISHIRQTFAYLPDEVWRFKLLYAWENADNIDVLMLNAVRGDTLSARINLGKLVECIMRIVFLLNRRYCPGSPKWLSREFYALPRLAKEIGPRLEACQALADIQRCRPIIEEVLQFLVHEHNRSKITAEVKLETAEFGRGQQSFTLQNMVKALEDSLPPELRDLEIRGACDQWITNSDVLIWAEHYIKFKNVYKKKGSIKRDGVGDMII